MHATVDTHDQACDELTPSEQTAEQSARCRRGFPVGLAKRNPSASSQAGHGGPGWSILCPSVDQRFHRIGDDGQALGWDLSESSHPTRRVPGDVVREGAEVNDPAPCTSSRCQRSHPGVNRQILKIETDPTIFRTYVR